MQFAYLLGLLIGIGGMAIIDHHYRLAYWNNKRRTITTVLISVAIFILWDMLGIWLGIFFHGGSAFTLQFRILPEFPLEEIFFLILLCYCTLVIYNGIYRRCSRI